MPKPSITLKKAVAVAELSMILKRQTYKFDASMYDRGVYNAKTINAKEKYNELTESIALLKSLVAPVAAAVDPVDTK